MKAIKLDCGHTISGMVDETDVCPICVDPSSWSRAPEMGTGKRYNAGKPPLDLIPAKAEVEEAKVWGAGAAKYGRHNWLGGMPYSTVIGSLQRHLNAIKSGEDYDPETGALHAGHIRCNAAMLIEFLDRPELDDRYKVKVGR